MLRTYHLQCTPNINNGLCQRNSFQNQLEDSTTCPALLAGNNLPPCLPTGRVVFYALNPITKLIVASLRFTRIAMTAGFFATTTSFCVSRHTKIKQCLCERNSCKNQLEHFSKQPFTLFIFKRKGSAINCTHKHVLRPIFLS